ncbi:MAG TPA: thioredoxin domain-containing protein [Pseudomonadales bacterium]|nr:thioredoxin domain-containing protein [Pseudomonadales bacterium]
MDDADGRNRLDACSSPYLRQHADNPVHWQPWDDAALAEALSRDVPILLSIGYSSCHWCHVMAHESFEDADTAAAMNSAFVCIKVDREERPDLDRVYQTAHQILTQQPGGWPLTVFLDPRTRVPFFSGTYFPRTPRYGMPGFTDLLGRVETVWAERREELAQQGAKVQEIFDALNAPAEEEAPTGPTAVPDEPAPRPALPPPDATLLDAAREQLGTAYDATDGGFGGAPKFPMTSCLERLLRHWAATDAGSRRDGEALEMAMQTLTQMARGGIYDHLGGGFCRYATDAKWLVPHFEKMLYDNGALLALYADAMAIAPDPLLESVVRDTAAWLIREMQHEAGGFFAALDADSEGEEGRFYVWHREQVRRLLDDDEYQLIATLYAVDKPANFEGNWILHRRDAWRSVVERLDLEPARADALLASARAKLLAERDTRPRPDRDDKVLVAWNGLAIRGLARAAQVMDEPAWEAAATRAVDFIRTRMVVDGRLHAYWIDDALGVRAYLEDHALLLEGLLTLLMRRWRDADLRFAVDLADALLEHFRDPVSGGFFQTADDAERLIHRPKPGMDEALPAGNAVAARALGRLGHLLGRSDYLEAAAETVAWASPMIARAPQAHCAMLDALEDLVEAPEQVIVRGDDATEWAREAGTGYRPRRCVYALPTVIEAADGFDAPLLPAYVPETLPASTVAWICTSGRCSLPITTKRGLTAELGGNKVVSLRPK